MFKFNPEKLRCLVCNLKSMDLGDGNEKRKAIAAGSSTTKKQMAATMDQTFIQAEEAETMTPGEERALRSQSIINKRLMRLNKVMDSFDRGQIGTGSASLTLRDFK
jgi:hypothetical protein